MGIGRGFVPCDEGADLNQIRASTTEWKVMAQPASLVQRLHAGIHPNPTTNTKPFRAPHVTKLRCAPCQSPPMSMTSMAFMPADNFRCTRWDMSAPATAKRASPKNHHRSPHVPPCPKSGKDGCAVDGNGEDPHVTVASQGNVNVVFPPRRQGHVPSTPKVRRRGGPVGKLKLSGNVMPSRPAMPLAMSV